MTFMVQSTITTVISSCVVDKEVKPDQLLNADRRESTQYEHIKEVSCIIEDAAYRIVLHCIWQIKQGGSRKFVISNDSDTVMRLLCCFHHMEQIGLKELWVEYGFAEHCRHLPIHHFAHVLGERLFRILLKAYILSCDDSLNKVGTKYSATICEPLKFLGDLQSLMM